MLLEWDGSTGVDSPGASLYHVFRQRLAHRLLDSLDVSPRRAGAARAGRARARPRARAHARPARPRQGREPDRGRARRDLGDDAHADLGESEEVGLGRDPRACGWCTSSSARARARCVWVGRRLGVGPFAAPGDPDTAWTMYHGALPDRALELGPGLRYAVDLGDPDHALVGLAGGQSGSSGSAHYADALARLARRPAAPAVDAPERHRLPPGGNLGAGARRSEVTRPRRGARRGAVPLLPGMIVFILVPGLYAAVEQADNPALRGRPVVVGADPAKRGTVTSASREARARGVHEGMETQARARAVPRRGAAADPARALPRGRGRAAGARCAPRRTASRSSGSRAPSSSSRRRSMSSRAWPSCACACRRSSASRAVAGIGPTRFVAYLCARHAGPGGIRKVEEPDVRTSSRRSR